MKKITILLMIVLIIGCNNQTNNTNQQKEAQQQADSIQQVEAENEAKTKTETGAGLGYIDNTGIQFIENGAFARNALNDYSVKGILKKYKALLTCSKKPQINHQKSSMVDTIYTFQNTDNKIQFYRTAQTDLLLSFRVTDSRFKILSNIQPGISKEFFSVSLNITAPLNDTVKIGDKESNEYLTFYFENSKLKVIDYYTSVD
jgi:hypothetical protein